jgi:hypothetical protein
MDAWASVLIKRAGAERNAIKVVERFCQNEIDIDVKIILIEGEERYEIRTETKSSIFALIKPHFMNYLNSSSPSEFDPSILSATKKIGHTLTHSISRLQSHFFTRLFHNAPNFSNSALCAKIIQRRYGSFTPDFIPLSE